MYGESILTAKNNEDFIRAVNIIQDNTLQYYTDFACYPTSIVTFKEDCAEFISGQNAVLFCGDSHIQANLYRLLNCYDEIDLSLMSEEDFSATIKLANAQTKGLELLDVYEVYGCNLFDGIVNFRANEKYDVKPFYFLDVGDEWNKSVV